MRRAAARADIIIAGGGLAGLIQGVLLGISGWQVRILERGDAPAGQSDPRSIALSESSRRILDSVGVWDALADKCARITHIDVSQRGAFGATRLRAEDEGLPALGYVAPAASLAEILRAKIDAAPRCELQTRSTVEHIQPRDADIELQIRKGNRKSTMRGRLLIAADGARSSLRSALELEAQEVDYQQTALVCELQMDRAADGWAFERFTRAGPLALLPHPSGRRALIWALPRDTALQAQSWDDARFRREIQKALGSRAGQVGEIGARAFYELTLRRTQNRVGPRSVLIGDAAYGFHPIAAQGFNLVVRDAAWLAQELRRAHARGADPGSASLLEQYAKARDADARRVAGFTDFLARAFVAKNPLVRGLCAAGLMTLEGMPNCRTRLIRFGMGVDLPQSELARGTINERGAHA